MVLIAVPGLIASNGDNDLTQAGIGPKLPVVNRDLWGGHVFD